MWLTFPPMRVACALPSILYKSVTVRECCDVRHKEGFDPVVVLILPPTDSMALLKCPERMSFAYLIFFRDSAEAVEA